MMCMHKTKRFLTVRNELKIRVTKGGDIKFIH